MKRTIMLALGTALIISSAVLAAPADQDKAERPRRITMSSSSFLGVEIEEVTDEVAGRLRLREERGAWITSVTGDTAAARAGLQKDDVIVRWNGDPVESARALSRHLRETPGGRNVKLGVLRNGSEMEVAVRLGNRADYLSHISAVTTAPRARMIARPAIAARAYGFGGVRLGISLQSMSPQLAEYFGLQNRNGALVTFVHPDSVAARAGIKAGDVILSIGGVTVDRPGSVIEALGNRSEGAVEVKVMRDRQERTLTVQIEKGKTSMVWSDDDDVIVSEALVEPLEIGPITIAPFDFAPVAIPQIHIEAMPPVVVPEMNIAPVAIPQMRLAPITIPRMTVPKINMPKIVVPPVRIVVPEIVFRTEV
ncbi:MAG: PDZ domain-containing protein [Blastocatellia bacterium]